MRSVLVLLLFAGIFASGGCFAAGIKDLISPGPLSQAHQDAEGIACESCHAAFQQTQQTGLCLDCHEDIGADMGEKTNLHGQHPDVETDQCRSCHTEHRGADFDISGLILETFKHEHTDYALLGSHDLLECSACHVAGEPKRNAPTECAACHEDPHRNNLGQACGDCHQQDQWLVTDFDHTGVSEFVLLGAHGAEPCGSCHIDEMYEGTPQMCVDCHQQDDVHMGTRGRECAQCHDASSWRESVFDHAAATGFALQSAHAELECASCHLADMSLAEPPTTCVGCHSADDVHLGARGTECADCHNQERWSVTFDHLAETGFALGRAHESLACEACHVEGLEAELPSNCEGCHTNDDPHEASLGECASCHASATWSSPLRFDHEFTRFPLVGFHAVASCDQCHASLRFDTAPTACHDCHAAEDKHAGVFGSECEQCHNPGGWALWRFDHATQTTFALSGAHENLMCASCHNENSGDADNTSTQCVSCHEADDTHNGQFGGQCDQCHSSDSFHDEVRFR